MRMGYATKAVNDLVDFFNQESKSNQMSMSDFLMTNHVRDDKDDIRKSNL